MTQTARRCDGTRYWYRKTHAFFVSSLLLTTALASVMISAPVYADQMPASGTYDSRMRYVAYNPGQVVHLSAIIGATMVVTFAADEIVTSVAETDSLHLAAVPKGNYLFLKPNAALALQPIIVLTQRPDGSLRRYVFEIETVSSPTAADGTEGVFYSVQFTYPEDEAAAAAAQSAIEAAKVEQLNELALKRATQQAALAVLDAQRSNPFAGPRNYKYAAQGDHSLSPRAAWDNGYSTVLQFADNARIPAIFVINPDGKEATASYSVTGETVQIGETAREFRLRDGSTVLNIYNFGFGTAGGNPGTGTTSPDVSRIVGQTSSNDGASGEPGSGAGTGAAP